MDKLNPQDRAPEWGSEERAEFLRELMQQQEWYREMIRGTQYRVKYGVTPKERFWKKFKSLVRSFTKGKS